MRWQLPASFIGAGLGAWLLLHLPEKVFQQIVPVLLILALALVVVGGIGLVPVFILVVFPAMIDLFGRSPRAKRVERETAANAAARAAAGEDDRLGGGARA